MELMGSTTIKDEMKEPAVMMNEVKGSATIMDDVEGSTTHEWSAGINNCA